MGKVDLKIDWATHEAAKYACLNWHYSKSVPAGKLVKIGVWEQGRYIGAVVFGRGSNKAIGKPYGLSQTQAVELMRIALTAHITPVSRIIKIGMIFLKKNSPGLRLIISYADPREGHHGGIYQATNWFYVGESTGDASRNHPYKAPDGKLIHWRTMSGILDRIGKPHTDAAANTLGYKSMPFIAKHKYLYPLDPEMRKQIEPLRKPYPKRQASEVGDGPDHGHSGGAAPTRTLQSDKDPCVK
jgi:hypothetical protein